MYKDDFLDKKLDDRIANNSLRKLIQREGFIDFCSNDYLGIRTNQLLESFISPALHHGSGGARTLAGNYKLIEETEAMLADFHDAEAALIFNSGYNANTGVFSCVPQRGDTILYDSLSHASIRDGIKLSFADSFSFQHNDCNDLEEKLAKTKGTVFVATESLFSMDGDFAPLKEMTELCEKFGAHLIVDEAHANGVAGTRGEGLVQHLGLQKQTFARIHTFGKAIGTHGAAVLGSEKLKSYLINFSRSFIFTTALPESAVAAVKAAYTILPSLNKEREILQSHINIFQQAVLPFLKLISHSPIQAVIIPGNEEVKKVAEALVRNKLDVRPILYPTVPKGKERLRISLHSFNTADQLLQLINTLQTAAV
jgi:8-amino-7-oxononanoate synthase